MKLNSKENIIKNLYWRLLEGFGSQGVSFVVSIILARLLEPSVYGKIAIVMVFTSLMQVVVDSGLGNALIQKKDADNLDFSSVFYCNIFFCLLLYAILFIAAPFIADFYKMPDLIQVLRVLSLTIVISGLRNVQQAYVSKHMLFKKFFFATLGGTIGGAVIGIFMAYRGYGVWALVTHILFNSAFDTGILWVTVKWRPKRLFSLERLKGLFSYGWKLLVSKLLDTFYEDTRSLIIGKFYSVADLAFYNRGKQFPQLAVSNINTAIESVLFPSMSMEQDNLVRVRSMTSRAVRISSYFIMPMMAGLVACAEPIVNLILTPKWAPCIPYMRIFCIGLAIVPASLANLNAIKAMGRSDIYLKLEIIRKVINSLILLVFMWYGVIAIAFSYLINCIMNLAINAFPNKRMLNYGYMDQIKDLIPAVLLSTFMGTLVYFITFFHMSDWLTLLIQILVGGGIYLVGSLFFKIESFKYIMTIAKGYSSQKESK